MTVKLSEYAEAAAAVPDVPLCITFFGPKFCKLDGTETALIITVNVENGDVLGILDAVKKEGGLGELRGNQYVYLPWPCACVVMYRPDEVPLEIAEDFEPESEGL